jgi:hypothetical protein
MALHPSSSYAACWPVTIIYSEIVSYNVTNY